MDVVELMSCALRTENSAAEATDLTIHIAMVEAVREVSARWPRRDVKLTAGMGSCTIDVTGASGGRPILWRFYWGSDGVWEINDVHYNDELRHQVFVGRRVEVQSELIAKISEINNELHDRDPIDYAPTIRCVAGVVVSEEPVGSPDNVLENV